jgi:hypothetical protein
MSIFGRRRGRIAGLAISTAILVGGLPALQSASAASGSPTVGMAATYDAATKTFGYLLAQADGTVEPHGTALWVGDMRKTALAQPIVAIAETPSQKGYWLVASDGGVFNFGDAAFLGSMGGQKLNSPIVAMASTKSGKGYWLFAADGGVFSFGDAAFYGSMGGRAMNAPIVDAVASPSGTGYYMLGGDGGVFRFGNAPVNFSMADVNTGAPYAAIAVTNDGSGVRIVDTKGNKGHSPLAFDLIRDEPLPPASPVVDMVSNPVPGVSAGFYFVQADGGVYTFDGVPFLPAQNNEERTIKSNRTPIDAIIAAANAGDLAQARNASQTWDVIWHGVEVYLNFRSPVHYAKLEGDIQGRMNAELAKPAPDLASVASIATELAAEYDIVIGICNGGLSPIFDDLQEARFDRALVAQGVLQDLNAAVPNLGEAKAWWTQFRLHFDAANALIAGRGANAAAEAAAAVAAVDAAINTATVDQLKTLIGVVNTKFGVGVNLINAAARNAVPGKTAITFDDQIMVIGLNNIKISLSRANTAWKAGNYATAAAWAATAAGPQFDLVQPTLASKLANDNPLRTALNNFKALTGAAGSATAFDTAYVAAVNATNNAQQVIAGQFWLVPAVQKFVAGLPTS